MCHQKRHGKYASIIRYNTIQSDQTESIMQCKQITLHYNNNWMTTFYISITTSWNRL